MRLSQQNYKTPFISNNTMTEWIDNNDIFLPKVKYNIKIKRGLNRNGYSTFLKSFYNAPKWTEEELMKFKKVFEKYNIYTSSVNNLKL